MKNDTYWVLRRERVEISCRTLHFSVIHLKNKLKPTKTISQQKCQLVGCQLKIEIKESSVC